MMLTMMMLMMVVVTMMTMMMATMRTMMVVKMMMLMMMLTLALPERLQLERRPYLWQLSLFSPTLTLSSPFQLLEYQTDVQSCRFVGYRFD